MVDEVGRWSRPRLLGRAHSVASRAGHGVLIRFELQQEACNFLGRAARRKSDGVACRLHYSRPASKGRRRGGRISRFRAGRKVISRSSALEWWDDHMKATEAATLKTSKPYRATTDNFFADLHSITEADIRRALSSFDVRYEKEKWRSGELADHLLSWLPELALKASDLASVQHLRLRQKTREAIAAIKRNRSVTPEELLGETLLHVVVRQTTGSEPIACKLFVQGSGELRSFKNAHIVHTKDRDELWLGRAALAAASSYSAIVTQTMAELERALDTDFLKEERQTILALREPTHLLPTSLEAALSNGAPIDDLIEALCIPVLIAYDSAVLAGGYIAEYRARLIDEVTSAYAASKSDLPGDIKMVKVHIFLVPSSAFGH